MRPRERYRRPAAMVGYNADSFNAVGGTSTSAVFIESGESKCQN